MKNRQRGVAAVELALVLPLLLAIGFAITEFGRGIYTYNTLTKSARDASRYLSTQRAGDATAWATAKNLIVYGNPKGTGTPLALGLTPSMVDICDATSCPTTNLNQGTDPMINTVTVTITGYTFTPVLDILGFTRVYTGGTGSINSINFDPISVVMRQYR